MTTRIAPRALALAVALTLASASAASAADYSKSERELLLRWATDTWSSFTALVHEDTGLPADWLAADGTRAGYTSPTNIGMYLWAVVAARDLALIEPEEAVERAAATLASVAELERAHGQFYNWYDPATGERLTVWPDDGNPVHGFLSSVDNGWLASALVIVRNAIPQVRDEAAALLEGYDFGFYHDPTAGLLRGGAWTAEPPGCSVPDERDGAPVWFTCHHYGALNTEPRIASYLAIAWGQVPAEHYFRMWRTFPDTCDWSWQEMKPQGETRTYLGVDVFEGTYEYRGLRLVPSWGGSMFEALMVPLIVPEEEWGPRSWGINHPLYVRAQVEHGLEDAAYGYWGFSPSSNPAGGYREYGVDAIGLEPNGYASDQERTHVDYGFGDCPGREGTSIPEAYGQGVVTPHAVFLALEFDPQAAFANLERLAADFDVYGDHGWYDAVNVATGEVAERYLALDQGMVMAAVANALTNDKLQRWFVRGEVRDAIRPLLAIEAFGSGTVE